MFPAANTLLRSDRCVQGALWDVSKFAVGDGKGSGLAVPKVDWYLLVAKLAESPSARLLRSAL